MVHYNYPYKQYVHIAAAYNEGRYDEANKLLSELNRVAAMARVVNKNPRRKKASRKVQKVAMSNM